MSFNNSTNNLFREQKVVNSAVGYVVLADDVIINITDTTAPRTVTLPAPSTTNVGKSFFIKDTSGAAGTNNITVSGASGNIDGSATSVINNNYGSLTVYSDGTDYYSSSPIQQPITLASFKARKNTAQLIPTNLFITMANWTTVDFDITSDFNATTGVFTAPRAGRYLCVGSIIYIDTPLQGEQFHVAFSINGVAPVDESMEAFANSAAVNTFPTRGITTIYNLSATDTVSMQTLQNTGAPLNTHTDQNFNFFEVQELANSTQL